MQDSFVTKAPAKLNLFLRILDKNENNFHIIRTGITFLNLYDEIKIYKDNKTCLKYTGPFKPSLNIYKNDIVLKLLKTFSLEKKINLNIEIKKNIPWKAGLGSASTDAASLIKTLEKMGLISNVDNQTLSKIGSDVPACYYQQNSLVTGTGNEITTGIKFPKYFFVLVKPNINISTTDMYKKVKDYIKFNNNYVQQVKNLKTLHRDDNCNDFEKIIKIEYSDIIQILDFLSRLNKNSFSRISGSGSCCYAAFKTRELANKAFDITAKKFNNYWVHLAENNIN